MTTGISKYYVFLFLALLLSIPFYIWGALSPVSGLPFGLPISFLMIFVPFLLALVFAWREDGTAGIIFLFTSILDLRKAKPWAALFSIFCMPLALLLSFFTMQVLSIPLPAKITIPVREIPAMLILYFLGAIPEEFGWTLTLSEPLTKAHGPIKAGLMIGAVWALWHVIPWSWAHPTGWILGMFLLNLVIRIGMVTAFIYGGKSLFFAILFHAMINVSMGLFPNSGSHTNTWIITVWVGGIFGLTLLYLRGKRRGSPFQVGYSAATKRNGTHRACGLSTEEWTRHGCR
jgi:membrane protease YdiL (CAAX protease family)